MKYTIGWVKRSYQGTLFHQCRYLILIEALKIVSHNRLSMHHFETHHHFKQSDLNISLLYLNEWLLFWVKTAKTIVWRKWPHEYWFDFECLNEDQNIGTNGKEYLERIFSLLVSKYTCIFVTIHAEQYKKNSSHTRSFSRSSHYIPCA